MVRPLTALLAIALHAGGLFDEGDYSLGNANLYLLLLDNASVFYAFVSLMAFYSALKSKLQPFQPVGKFLCIKFVIFFAFWQSVFLSGAASMGAMSGGDSVALQNLLVVLEMALVSVAHLYTFPALPFLPSSHSNSSSNNRSRSGNKSKTARDRHTGFMPLASAEEDDDDCFGDSDVDGDNDGNVEEGRSQRLAHGRMQTKGKANMKGKGSGKGSGRLSGHRFHYNIDHDNDNDDSDVDGDGDGDGNGGKRAATRSHLHQQQTHNTHDTRRTTQQQQQPHQQQQKQYRPVTFDLETLQTSSRDAAVNEHGYHPHRPTHLYHPRHASDAAATHAQQQPLSLSVGRKKLAETLDRHFAASSAVRDFNESMPVLHLPTGFTAQTGSVLRSDPAARLLGNTNNNNNGRDSRSRGGADAML